jgi:hypothetical protein
MRTTTKSAAATFILIIILFSLISSLAALPSSSAARQLNTQGACSTPSQSDSNKKMACLSNIGNVDAARGVCDKVKISSLGEFGIIPSVEQLQRAKAFCQSSIFDLANCYCGPNCDSRVLFDLDLDVFGLAQTFIDSMAYMTLLAQANPASSISTKLPAALAPDVYGLMGFYKIDYSLSPQCYIAPSAPVAPAPNPDCTPIYAETAGCKNVSAGDVVYDVVTQEQISNGGVRGCSDVPVPLNQQQKLIEMKDYCPSFYCTQNPLTDSGGNQIGVRCATPCYSSVDGAQLCCLGKFIGPGNNPNLGIWTGPGTATDPIPSACSDFCNVKVCNSCLLKVDTSNCPPPTAPTTPSTPTTPPTDNCPGFWNWLLSIFGLCK